LGQSINVSEAPSATTVDSLFTNSMVVGNNNEGEFLQSGTSASTNTIVGDLTLGNAANSIGEYDLNASGAWLTASNDVIGASGSGTFMQSAGTNTVTGAMAIGELSNSSGTYILSGGTLSSASESLGVLEDSVGSFIQSGGAHTVAGTMVIAGLPSSTSSTYDLQAGSLSVGSETIGFGSTGAFTQSGGTNSVAGTLVIGTQDDLLFVPLIGTGSYNLSAGNLSSASISIGDGGNGTFTQSGGIATVGSATIQTNKGNGNLSQAGGILTATSVLNNGKINQTAGILNLGAVTGTGSIQLGNSTGNPHTIVASIAQASASILSNGLLTISANSFSDNSFGSLTIQSTGKLDLTNNHLFINYGVAPDPIAAIRGDIVSGYAGGAWNGPGIDSSTAALPANSHYGIGYADGADGVVSGLSSGQIEIKYTLYGDADLDGSVTGTDFTILDGHLGHSVTGWDKGDFDYDGVVTGSDFTALFANLGKSASGAAVVLPAADYAAIDAFAAANGLMADVPEPASMGILVTAGFGLIARRRRGG
jgi:hypothetical protein